MEATKLQVKFFVESPETLRLEPFVAVWHEWIRNKVLGELLIDVADYSHVHQGPGVLLVGSASDYYLDTGKGQPGLLYSVKRNAIGDGRERVEEALRRVLSACQRLEAESALDVRFRGDELLFRINDRLRAPNTDATLAVVERVLRPALEKLFDGLPFSMDREGTDRDLFTLRIRASGAPSAKDLLQRLA